MDHVAGMTGTADCCCRTSRTEVTTNYNMAVHTSDHVPYTMRANTPHTPRTNVKVRLSLSTMGKERANAERCAYVTPKPPCGFCVPPSLWRIWARKSISGGVLYSLTGKLYQCTVYVSHSLFRDASVNAVWTLLLRPLGNNFTHG